MNEDLITHGAKLDAQGLGALLTSLFDANLKLEEDTAERPTPICIWGTHGIGKTQLAASYARERGWDVAYCALAQFEEMGDLHGLPVKLPGTDGQPGKTAYLAPDWVPTEAGPGLLLIDDFNRADDRILRGIMQLLQNYELFSWSLPPKWQIVLTANPEGGDYSVTPLDDAMLTRMIHATMVFDVRAWAAWATRAGVDSRGIAFVLTYPEVVNGQRTTARSLTQFFGHTRRFDDLSAHVEVIYRIGLGCLDAPAVASFMAFVNGELGHLLDPEEVLDAVDFEPIRARILELAGGEDGSRRIDRLSTLCTRVVLFVCADGYEEGPRHRENLVQMLLMEEIPTDLRFSIHRDLSARGQVDMVRDKRLARLVLAGMG